MNSTDPVELSICLARHGRKRWAYRSDNVDVVEVATLDYLKDRGWQGYFTERNNYFLLCALIMGFPFPEKTTKKALSADRRLRREVYPYGLDGLFNMGRDGFIKLHDYSFDEVYSNIQNYKAEDFPSALNYMITHNIEPFSISNKRISRNASRIITDEVIKFFETVGVDGVANYVHNRVSKEELLAKVYLNEFDNEYWTWSTWAIQSGRISDDFKESVDEKAIDDGCGIEFLFQAAFHYAGGFEGNIDKVKYFSNYVSCEKIKRQILDAVEMAEDWRARLISKRETTVLDLQLWDKEGLAYAEVKAPNDRLRSNQKATVSDLISRGERVMVIYVSEE